MNTDHRAIMNKLTDAYNTLSAFEKALIQMLSIIYEPVTPENLAKCIKKVKSLFPTKLKCDVDDLVPYLEKLRKKNLIDENLRCDPAVIEVISRKAIWGDKFKKMAVAVRETLPVSNRYRQNSSEKCRRYMRDFRISIYTHDVSLHNESFRLLSNRCTREYREHAPLVSICNRPFDPKWFSTLEMDIQTYALYRIFINTAQDLESDREALNYAMNESFLKRIPEYEKPGFFSHLSSRLVLGGRVNEADKLIRQIGSSDYSGGILGWIDFVSGKNENAVKIFEADLTELRRRVGKKKAYFQGISGIFYVLALLKLQDVSLLSMAEGFAAESLKRQYQNTFTHTAFKAFTSIIHSLSGHKDNIQEMISDPFSQMDELAFLFCALAGYWTKGSLDENIITRLKQIHEKAVSVDMMWVALEAASLIYHCGSKYAGYKTYVKNIEKKYGIKSIVPFIRIEDPWQKSLTALGRILDKDRKKAALMRLVWIFKYTDKNVEINPKVQKLTAKGNWSKGRPVALSRLLNHKSLDYLTPRDRQISTSIEKESNYHYGVSYNIDYSKALPALVGHPLVFLEDSAMTPVEIVKGPPEVIVEQEKNNYKIRMIPKVSEDVVEIIEESPTRFRVIQLSDEHRQIAKILGINGLTIPISAKKKVMDSVAGLSSIVTVHSSIEGRSESVEEVLSDTTPCIHLTPAGKGFRLEIFVQPFSKEDPLLKPGQGAAHLISEINGSRIQTVRDLAAEKERIALMEEQCPTLSIFHHNNYLWTFDEPEDCLRFLIEIREMQERKEVWIKWPEGKPLKVTREISSSSLHLKFCSKDDWFEISGELQIDDKQVINIKELLDLIAENKTRFIPFEDGSFLSLTNEFRRRLEEMNAFSQKKRKKIQFHPLAAQIFEDLIEGFTNIETDKTWKLRLDQIRKGLAVDPLIPSNLKAELRDYQIEGFKWLARLAHMKVGACLADDMGLGKTIQALAIVLERAPGGSTLVVAPTSVCANWISEAARFAPTINPISFGGKKRKEIIENAGPFDLVVSSYGLLQQESELLASVKWQTIILDEAQAIKNVMAKRSRAAMTLKGKFKMITTGTPIENHLGEFHTLFNFINPGFLGSRKHFNGRFAVPIEKNKDKEARLRLKKLIQPFLLRRIKSQVLDELPPRTEVVLQVEMSKEEMAFYEALRQKALENIEDSRENGGRHIEILAQIMKLRQACCNPQLILPKTKLPSAKLDIFGKMVGELLENRHKALVFSQFVGHLSIIRKYLDKQKINYRYLDGSTPAKKRKQEVDAFQAGEGDLFLISLKAGGLGLNLTAASYVIHMDPWWNPAVEDQASDRAHRIGQKYPVTIYKLVAKNTIEEKIVKLHQHKRNLAGSLLEGADMSGKMSTDELVRLIREP
ncbi:DEAD/DEAH box helicase [Desulfobacterales bacterium HSG16]|nr:DEAD/DEAH box helicase [Desulfobacterales bacterium HSG16]